ncbi:hypothetical protein ACGFNU_50580 [Spirillospora sp. NPDC048911]|uniref:hypothetical protein n=1 Tax=Spirillospora sp. NPDC048911 TaxID=3364527 RepID=UPI00371D405D
MPRPVPTIVKATVTPILISDPPLLNCLGVHQPHTPRSIVELETDTGVTGAGETYLFYRWAEHPVEGASELDDVRDRDDVAAMRKADPAWTQPSLPRW